MVRKKAVPAQSEIEQQQLEVHEEHLKEKDEFMHDFAGPVVFYEYFSQRTTENLLFRRKNIFFPIYFAIRQLSERKEWKFRIWSTSRRMGLLAVYLIKVQSTENNNGCRVQMISSFHWDSISEGNDLIHQFPFLKHDKQKSNICLVFYYTNEDYATSSTPIFVQIQSFIQAICNDSVFNPATANSYIAMLGLELRDQQTGTRYYCFKEPFAHYYYYYYYYYYY